MIRKIWPFSLLILLLMICACDRSTSSIRGNPNDTTKVLPDEEPCGVIIKNQVILSDTEIVVPVIEYSNKAVQDSINATLTFEKLSGRTIEELMKEKEEYKNEGVPNGLAELNYLIFKNADCVLSISSMKQECYAYCTGYSKVFNYDLNTGKILKITDIIKAESLDKLAAICDAQLQKNIEITRKENREIEKEYKGIYDGYKFTNEDLKTFHFSDNGLIFSYDFDFPHVIQCCSPNGYIEINKAELSDFLIKHQFGL